MAARFFMNLRYRDRYFRDDEGDELPGVNAAYALALATARDMIRRIRTRTIRNWFDCTFEITDESGRVVLVVPFADTLEKPCTQRAEGF